MDSVSQIALGAALSVSVMGRHSAVWKAALWGGVAGTLPDLDVVINYGDPILNMVRHRAESHSLLYLSVLAPIFGWGVSTLQGGGQARTALWLRWTIAFWLVLFTHPLLDVMTVYGTRLLIPFTDHPFGLGSIFIIDPLYTVPLLVGLAIALILKSPRGLWWNTVGLALSSAYLVWGAWVQLSMTDTAQASLKESGIQAERLLVNPTAFNSVLWRMVAMTPEAYYEGFRSLLDETPHITWQRYPRCAALEGVAADNAGVAAIAKFSHGFYSLGQQEGRLIVSDLRMGQEPYYFFRFDVGPSDITAASARSSVLAARAVGQRPDIATALPWLWQRLKGQNSVLPAADNALRSPQDVHLARCGIPIKTTGDKRDTGASRIQ